MRALLLIAAAVVWGGCSGVAEPDADVAPRTQVSAVEPTREDPTGPAVVAFGDSLTAGYGLARDDSYPAVLERELGRRGLPYRVVNEGVSGDTTAAALARVDLSLSHEDAVLAVIAIGANDGLRGLPVDRMESNIREIVRRFRASGMKVVLAGMRLPPNFGPEYVSAFEATYPKLAEELDVPLLPFLLEGVAADPGLNQDDGIHPNEEGAVVVAATVADFLEPLLGSPAERAE